VFHYACHLSRVIDGDTVELTVDLGFCITVKEKFRLARINAPEMNTAEGRRAKEYAIQWFFDHENLTLQSEKLIGKDKFGRYLGWIYGTDKRSGIQSSLNQDLLDSDNAKNYGS
jgi:micrococcal nuclease